MPAGSLVSPKLGCGAGGACPVPEGGSRIWPILAALGPSPVTSWPPGPQEYGALTYWVLCTESCRELFLCTEVMLGPAVPKTSAGRDSKQERNEGKRGEKEKPKGTWCADLL